MRSSTPLRPFSAGEGEGGRCEFAGHVVQFYDTDVVLVESLADYFAEGFTQHASGIVIATAEHLREFTALLGRRGIDIEPRLQSGQLVVLEARATLREICCDGEPNEERFNQVIGTMVETMSGRGRVRAFGELVALLCEDGKADAAIQLEEFWNRLLERHAIELLCAYPMRVFRSAESSRQFAQICRMHERVRPAESFFPQTGLNDPQLRQIALLQQRAAALEAEAADRAAAEHALRGTDDRLRHMAAIVEGSDDAILSKNLQGIITSWNPAAVRIFGYEADEMIGKSITVLLPEERLAEEEMIIGRLRRGERIDHYETLRRRKDGALIPVSLTISPVKNARGEIVGASKIVRDITERNTARLALEAAREELRRANHELEERVRERTASLTDLLSQMETFSYTISHDLRAPLRSMAGFAQALKDEYSEQLDGQARQFVDRIIRASERMNALINDVLAYARVNRDRMELGEVSTLECLMQVLQHATDLQPPAANIRIPESMPNVVGNEAFLTQVFSNLLGNAVKFVPAGRTPEVDVSVQQEDGMVRIEIADNGIGIRPECQGRLFGLFERLQTEKRYDGTGIGLAIVRRAVERMGGTIGVISDGQRGSRFWFTLPLVEEAVPPDAGIADGAETARLRPGAEGEAGKPGARAAAEALLRPIIAVDDNSDDNFMMMRRLLKQAELQAPVEMFDSGEAAIGRLEQLLRLGTLPVVCFLDIKMPGLNGFDVLRWIREQPAMEPVPVVILSSSDEPRDLVTAMIGGAQCFAKKHPSAGALRGLLGEVMERVEQPGAPRRFRWAENLLTEAVAAEAARLQPMGADGGAVVRV